uniref:LolSALOc n=1 Tax=Bichromomyia olmeca TaxID=715919 RepID=A0A1B1V3E1_9DIPT|nr:LolSALOc [Bichromomyia olmeca]
MKCFILFAIFFLVGPYRVYGADEANCKKGLAESAQTLVVQCNNGVIEPGSDPFDVDKVGDLLDAEGIKKVKECIASEKGTDCNSFLKIGECLIGKDFCKHLK